MKRNIFTIIVMYVALAASAQSVHNGNKAKLDQYRTQKVAFFTQKLQLTPDEAQVFWPVYNQYEKKKIDLLREIKKTGEELRAPAVNMSAKDFEKMADEFVDLKVKQAALLQEYHVRFKTILPSEKLWKLYRTEEQFNREIFDKVQQRPKK